MSCLSHPFFKKKIHKILEYGCSEMQFFVHMKNGLVTQDLDIRLVDIAENILKSSMHAVNPLLSDHINKRKHKLKVEVWKGNVAKPNPNFKDIDCVIAMELIEHVYPDILEEIPYQIFRNVSPKMAIITTPNVEFNSLFTFEKGRIFRHDDHKFEWTREQFQCWCDNICLRFPDYIVQFYGIGPPPLPSQIETHGYCSQMALFIRKEFIEFLKSEASDDETTCNDDNDDNQEKEVIQCDGYKLLASFDYPVLPLDTRDRNEKIIDEASYQINRYKYMEAYYNNEKCRIEIPIKVIANACWEVTDDKDEIRTAIKEKFKIENELIVFEDEYEDDDNEENQDDYNYDVDENNIVDGDNGFD